MIAEKGKGLWRQHARAATAIQVDGYGSGYESAGMREVQGDDGHMQRLY